MGNRIGVLLEKDPSAYSLLLRTRLTEVARTANHRLSFFEVDWPHDPERIRPGAPDGILSRCEEFDAVVVLSAVVSHRLSAISRFAQHWAPKPIVNIGYRLAGVPSLVLDNRGAQQLATSHLIEHGRRRLIYVRGRTNNLEAKERYLGYRRALHDHGILFESRLVIDGNFTPEGAFAAFTRLAADVEFDGVVAANDDMALSVMTELLKRNRKIPDEVAIIGFDDVDAARAAAVPLSTMAQPFSELARRALSTLQQALDGNEIQALDIVPVKLIARKSCGC